MKYIILFLILFSAKLSAQQIQVKKLSLDKIFQTLDHKGIDSVFALTEARNNFVYLDLLDTNLAVLLCTHVNLVDDSSFGLYYISKISEVLFDTIINNKLLNLIHKYQNYFSINKAFNLFPSQKLFIALVRQNFKYSIPILKSELNYWNQIKNKLHNPQSSNYSSASAMCNYLSQTIESIVYSDSLKKSSANPFGINSNFRLGRGQDSIYDTFQLVNKVNRIEDIDFANEPNLINHLTQGDTSIESIKLIVIHNNEKAILCSYFYPMEQAEEVMLLNNGKLLLKYMNGGVN